MHGNPGRRNKVKLGLRPPPTFGVRARPCSPRVCMCTCTLPRAGIPGASAYGTMEENYWFSFTPRSRAPRFTKAARKEAPSRSLGTARSPCIRTGRQWPRVSESAVPSGNRDENRTNEKGKEKRNKLFNKTFPSMNLDMCSVTTQADVVLTCEHNLML